MNNLKKGVILGIIIISSLLVFPAIIEAASYPVLPDDFYDFTFDEYKLKIDAISPTSLVTVLKTSVQDGDYLYIDHFEDVIFERAGTETLVKMTDLNSPTYSGIYCDHNKFTLPVKVHELINNYGCFEQWNGLPNPWLIAFYKKSLPFPHEGEREGYMIEAHSIKYNDERLPRYFSIDYRMHSHLMSHDLWCIDYPGFFPDTLCPRKASEVAHYQKSYWDTDIDDYAEERFENRDAVHIDTGKDIKNTNHGNDPAVFNINRLKILYADDVPGNAKAGLEVTFLPVTGIEVPLNYETVFGENSTIVMDLGGEYCRYFRFSINDQNIDVWCKDSSMDPGFDRGKEDPWGYVYACYSSFPNLDDGKATNCLAPLKEYYCPDFISDLKTTPVSKTGSDGCCGDDSEGTVLNELFECNYDFESPSNFLDWNKVTCTKTTPNNLVQGNYNFHIFFNDNEAPFNKTYYGWFDNISIKNANTGEELIKNGGFESIVVSEEGIKTAEHWVMNGYIGEGIYATVPVEPNNLFNRGVSRSSHSAGAYQGFFGLYQPVYLEPGITYTISYYVLSYTGKISMRARAAFPEILSYYSLSSDLGYIDPSGKYFCAKDKNPDTPSSDPVVYLLNNAKWSWWNAQEMAKDQSYRIHTVKGPIITDFVSNNEKWMYCSPDGSGLYGKNYVTRFNTFPQGNMLSQYCICAELFGGSIPNRCDNERKNCCTYDVGPSCDMADPSKPIKYSECGVCYDEQGNEIVQETESSIEDNIKLKDTSSVLNPEFATINFNPRNPCEYNGGVPGNEQGKLCENHDVCTSNYYFLVLNSANNQPGDSCCVIMPDENNGIFQYDSQSLISCQQAEIASCADQGKTLCTGDRNSCLNGHISQSSDDAVCCDSQDFCYDPNYSAELDGFNVNESFICYEEPNAGVFGECCNELTSCYNVKNQNSNSLVYDSHVFGVGTPTHSIGSFETAINGFLRTMVIYVENPLKQSVYGSSINIRNYRKQDFSMFDNLEFNIYYSLPQNPKLKIISGENNKESIYENVMNYSLNGINPGKWHRVKIPILELQRMGVDITDVAWARVTNINNGVLMLDNFHLTIDDEDKNAPLATRYCSGYFKKWVDDFDPPSTVIDFSYSNIGEWGPYKDVCNYNFFGWTGTKCCGDDQSFTRQPEIFRNEVYEDKNGGCWNGDYVYNNERLSDKTREPGDEKIIYFDGKFRECDGETTIIGYDGEGASEVTTKNEPIGAILGSWVCQVDGTWGNTTYQKQKTARAFLASKLFNISKNDFTLDCGPIGKISNIAYSDSTFACILNNDFDSLHGKSLKAKDVYVGLIYDTPESFESSLKIFVPFNNKTASQISLDGVLSSCGELGNVENFTKCSVVSSGGNKVYIYHNPSQKSVIFGFKPIDDWEDRTIFKEIWQAISRLFIELFNPSPKYYSTGVYLEAYPDLRPDYERFFVARVAGKSIIGSLEKLKKQSDPDSLIKVEYKNFQTLDLSVYLEKIKPLQGYSSSSQTTNSQQSFLIGCNSSTLYLKNIRESEKYWNFFTRSMSINPAFTPEGQNTIEYNCENQ